MSSRVIQGTLLAVLALAPIPVLGLTASLAEAGEPVVLDRIVAVVNDEIILQSDLDLWMVYDEVVQQEIMALASAKAPEAKIMAKFEELRPQALDELIARRLMLAQAPTFGAQFSASDAELDAYLQSLARGAGMSGIPELEQAVEQSRQYGTWKQYTNKLREDIILFKFEGALVNVAVSDAQVLERYRQLSKGEEGELAVRRIEFQPTSEDASASDAAFKQAKLAVRRIRAGESLETIASELGQSGEVETIKRSDVARPIGERLFAAQAGQVIGPLQSGQGFVVFEIEEVIKSDLLGFEEAKEALREQLQNEAVAKGKRELREQLRSRAHVDIRL